MMKKGQQQQKTRRKELKGIRNSWLDKEQDNYQKKICLLSKNEDFNIIYKLKI